MNDAITAQYERIKPNKGVLVLKNVELNIVLIVWRSRLIFISVQKNLLFSSKINNSNLSSEGHQQFCHVLGQNV